MDAARLEAAMAFQGNVQSVTAMLQADRAVSDSSKVGMHEFVRNTAATNAADCHQLLATGHSVDECWRFGILQTLDDYTSALKRGGVGLAKTVFQDEPEPTGSGQLDAAFAALADYLAERDGWSTPAWVLEPNRRTTRWYPAVPEFMRAEADAESPRAFRRRGIRITHRSLARA